MGDDQGDQTYAVRRFTDEVNRLFGVLNNQLYRQPYLAGSEYTIADMICYPWAVNWEAQGQDINEFKYFKRWLDELSERAGVKKGMAVGSDLGFDVTKLSQEEERPTAQNALQPARPPGPGIVGLSAEAALTRASFSI